MLLRVISPLLLLASWFWLPIGARPAIYSCLVVAWTVSLCSPPFSDTNQKVEFNKLNDNSAKNRQIVLALQAIVLMFLGRNLLISRTPNSSCSSTSANELDASQSSHNVHTLLISILSAVCLYVYAYAAGFTEARLTGRQPLESVLLTLPWPIGWMVNACLVVNGVALPGADHLPAPSGSHVERSLPPTPISTAGNTTTAQNMSTSTPVATVSPATSMTTAISNTGAAPVPGAAAENERFVAQYYQAVSKVGQASAQAQAVRSGSGGSTWRGDAVEIDPRSELDEHLTDGSSAHAADVRRGLVDRTTDNARQAMFAVLGYDGTDPSHVALYDHIQWRLQHTFNPAQQIGERGQSAVSVWWGGQGAKSVREFGIVLRGTCYCPQPAYRVARWLIEHNKSVGFEGLAQTSEVLHRTVETGSSNRTDVKTLR